MLEDFTGDPNLWNSISERRGEAISRLYAPVTPTERGAPDAEAIVTAIFCQTLQSLSPAMPSSSSVRQRIVWKVILHTFHSLRSEDPPASSIEPLAVSLRPSRLSRSETLSREVCALLSDFHHGRWAALLTLPQEYLLESAIARALSSMPPVSLEELWDSLNYEPDRERGVVMRGVAHLRATHATAALLHGLRLSDNHALKMVMVEALEEISEPESLCTLRKLYRETAEYDWTLSKRIGRAIRIIERQYNLTLDSSLPRPARAPANNDLNLLRPVSFSILTQDERIILPRPAIIREDIEGKS